MLFCVLWLWLTSTYMITKKIHLVDQYTMNFIDQPISGTSRLMDFVQTTYRKSISLFKYF